MEQINNFRKSSRVEKTAIVLILIQLVFKAVLEIWKSFEATMVIIPIVTIVLTLAWIGIAYACLSRKKDGYLWGGITGILHIFLALPLPFLIKACDHYFIAIFVSIHGLLISVFSFLAYRRLIRLEGQK